MEQARAILWAQWRTLANFYPRAGAAWTSVLTLIWYGIWAAAAAAFARVFSDPRNLPVIRTTLPGGLLLMFLYWQIVPLLLAATGAALDLRKLRAYPIPASQLFSIEVMLRLTAAIEMILLLAGIIGGALFNPVLRKWSLLAAVLWVLFNLVVAVGLRDLVGRLLARKRIRELAFFLLVLAAALPQLLMARNGFFLPQVRLLVAGDAWRGSPWTAVSNLIQGKQTGFSIGALFLWTLVAGVFSEWQFARTLRFDLDAANAGSSGGTMRSGLMEKFYRFPSAVLPSPLGILIEKEFRCLLRSPRFRLVFLMGFTFGLLIWLPMAFGYPGPTRTFFNQNYLTVVSMYSLLLLSESCFWNAFGFDRSAAQFYFLAPLPFARVLIGKNLTALFFVALEISMVTTVCWLLKLPMDARRLSEAYGVVGVVSILLLSAGNLLSIHQARGVNPGNSFRTGAAGRVQAMLFGIYPLAFAPVALAYLARYAFDNQAAFYAVLALDAIGGFILYRVALDSAVQAAERLREQMIAALSSGDGPIAG
jgi:ABC-2 type transport system permease protein